MSGVGLDIGVGEILGAIEGGCVGEIFGAYLKF